MKLNTDLIDCKFCAVRTIQYSGNGDHFSKPSQGPSKRGCAGSHLLSDVYCIQRSPFLVKDYWTVE